MSRKTIEKLTFQNWDQDYGDTHEMLDGEIGVYVSETDEGRTRIHLFGIDDFQDERYGMDYMPQSAPIICQQVLDQVAPDLSLSDVEWQYTKPPVNATFEYKERGGAVCGLTIKNDSFAMHGFPESLETYEDALNDPRGFETALMGDHHIHDNETKVVVIPIPHHPLSYATMTPNYTAENSHIKDNFELVLVDAETFRQHWMKQRLAHFEGEEPSDDLLQSMFREKSVPYDKDEDIALLRSSVETAIDHTNPHYSPINPAYVHYRDDHLSFSNGRHRSSNLATLGAPFIPVEFDRRSGLEEFKAKFEWKGGGGDDAAKPKLGDDHDL